MRRFLATACAGSLVGLAALGCGKPAPGASGRNATPTGAPPGIVVLCLDTLRADAVDALDAGGRMRALDAFARTSTAFSDASSAAAWTAPAVASLLTGRTLARHGVRGPLTAPPLAPSVPTLAESFRGAGWHCAAATSGLWVTKALGYARGFDDFREDFDDVGPEAVLAGFRERRPADRPFLLFLHTYAPHNPYGEKPATADPARRGAYAAGMVAVIAAAGPGEAPLPPREIRWLTEILMTDPAAYAVWRDTASAGLKARAADQIHAWLDAAWALDPEAADVPDRFRSAYARGLDWSDRVVARTLRALDAARLPEGTVVAVVSDHGEAFGEHGVLGHRSLTFDEIVRVPLIVRAPGRLEPGVVAGSCGIVDLFPTLLDLAGIAPPADVDGRSLLALARGDSPGHPVVAEADRVETRDGARLLVRRTSVRTEQAKYVVASDPRTRVALEESLYDLVADPGERNPLPAEGFGRYGRAFCEAVAEVRAAWPSLPDGPRCPRD